MALPSCYWCRSRDLGGFPCCPAALNFQVMLQRDVARMIKERESGSPQWRFVGPDNDTEKED